MPKMSQSGGLNYSKKNTPKNKPPPKKKYKTNKNIRQTKLKEQIYLYNAMKVTIR